MLIYFLTDIKYVETVMEKCSDSLQALASIHLK